MAVNPTRAVIQHYTRRPASGLVLAGVMNDPAEVSKPVSVQDDGSGNPEYITNAAKVYSPYGPDDGSPGYELARIRNEAETDSPLYEESPIQFAEVSTSHTFANNAALNVKTWLVDISITARRLLFQPRRLLGDCFFNPAAPSPRIAPGRRGCNC